MWRQLLNWSLWVVIVQILSLQVLLYLLNIIAMRVNPFCDGEYNIKDLILETAPFLFEEFAYKDKIIQA